MFGLLVGGCCLWGLGCPEGLCQPTGRWGQILGQLANWPNVSQSWCWLVGGWAGSCYGRLWGCSGPGACAHLLVGKAKAKGFLGLVLAW